MAGFLGVGRVIARKTPADVSGILTGVILAGDLVARYNPRSSAVLTLLLFQASLAFPRVVVLRTLGNGGSPRDLERGLRFSWSF